MVMVILLLCCWMNVCSQAYHAFQCIIRCWAPVIDKMIFYQQQLGAQTAGRANELSSQIILF